MFVFLPQGWQVFFKIDNLTEFYLDSDSRKLISCPGGMAQVFEHHPRQQKITSSILHQGVYGR